MMTPNSPLRLTPASIAALCVLGGALGVGAVDAREAPSPPDAPTRQAHARLAPSKGSAVRGHATLGETDDDSVNMIVHVVAAERGRRTVSLARDGRCDAEHQKRKRGDLRWLGTVDIDEDGRGTLEVEVVDATLGHDKKSLLGHALIVHTDDVLACGNIQRPKGK
jgi:Cu/Zn superoxide dismutase